MIEDYIKNIIHQYIIYDVKTDTYRPISYVLKDGVRIKNYKNNSILVAMKLDDLEKLLEDKE